MKFARPLEKNGYFRIVCRLFFCMGFLTTRWIMIIWIIQEQFSSLFSDRNTEIFITICLRKDRHVLWKRFILSAHNFSTRENDKFYLSVKYRWNRSLMSLGIWKVDVTGTLERPFTWILCVTAIAISLEIFCDSNWLRKISSDYKWLPTNSFHFTRFEASQVLHNANLGHFRLLK